MCESLPIGDQFAGEGRNRLFLICGQRTLAVPDRESSASTRIPGGRGFEVSLPGSENFAHFDRSSEL